MSRSTSPADDRQRVLGVESGLDALKASPEFRGPVETIERHDHDCIDHLALIYENDDERFSAAVPFMRQGLERGERCMYIVEEGSREGIVEAMRETGVDVDGALASGALTFHTLGETYLRNGSFDVDDMIDVYADAIDEATEEYAALRVTAGTAWITDDDVSIEEFLEYESKVNDLFAEEDCIALCQYDRNRIPEDVICDVVRTHPHLIYDSTVCHNFYYTPPEEFFGPEESTREVDRMMGTLLERTEAKVALQDREQFLRDQNEIIANPDRSFEEKLQAMFDLGCERFGLELGAIARVDTEDDWFQIEHVSDGHDHFEPGVELPLSETFCTAATGVEAAGSVTDPEADGYGDVSVYREFGLRAYLGTHIDVDGGADRTFFFTTSDPRDETFSDEEHTFLRSMGQWVKYELERELREDRLAALNTLSRRLMDVETATEMAELTVERAREDLRFPVTAVAHYDESGDLSVAAQTPRAEDTLPTAMLCDSEGGPAWEALIANETRTVDGVSESGALTEMAIVPLGNRGSLITATARSGGFGPADVEFLETTASTIEAAFTRAAREQLLHERERALEQQNESLERLDRINDTIRGIDQVLVSASTRSEIEAAVCEQLIDAGPYKLAWVGEHDPTTDEVKPRQWAGAEEGFLERTPVTADGRPEGRGPTGRAVRTRKPQVMNNVLTDSTYDPWREAALSNGYHSSIALPLLYNDTLYGVLNVYAGQPGVFDDVERETLVEMSETIAYAINAVESKKALVSDQITELDLDLTDTSFPIVDLCIEHGWEMALEGLVPQTDGRVRLFFTTRGVVPARVLDFESELPVVDLQLVSDHDENGESICLFEAVVTDGSPCSTALDHGGIPRCVRVEADSATMTIELAADAEVREFVETFQRRHSGGTVLAQRSRERSRRTVARDRAAFVDDLTDRQLEVLRTAYYSGYFDKPRTRTGSEIAASLGITQPTFNHHMRTAQRKLGNRLFEETLTPVEPRPNDD